MLKVEDNKVTIRVYSEDELLTDLAGLLIEVKRQLRFKLGKNEGTQMYNDIISTASKFN